MYLDSDRRPKPLFVQLGMLCLALLFLTLCGCGLLRVPISQSQATGKPFQLETKAPDRLLPPDQIQAQVMRFADIYTVQVAEAADDFSSKVTSPEARVEAMRWKLGQATSAYIDATGPNPYLNVLDMLVLVTLSRMVIEDYGIKTYGDAALPLLATQLKLETNAWTLAGGMLKPSQQQELRDLILEWRQKNPNQRSVGSIRFHEFAVSLGHSPKPGNVAPTSIFSLLFLDPLAGLDPTTAALQETRLLGERAMYYSQRMPALLAWQTELVTYQLADQPESKQVLSDAARLAASAESFSRTVEQLPKLANEQRQAAIQQVLDAMNAQDVKMRGLLSGAQQTLTAGNEMATAVDRAIKSLDEFVQRVSAPSTNRATDSTNSRPFDVLDYGTAASQIGAAADKLNLLITSLKDSEAQATRLNAELTTSAERVVHAAFWRAVMLIIILLVGAVLAGLAYQFLTIRLAARSKTPIAKS